MLAAAGLARAALPQSRVGTSQGLRTDSGWVFAIEIESTGGFAVGRPEPVSWALMIAGFGLRGRPHLPGRPELVNGTGFCKFF